MEICSRTVLAFMIFFLQNLKLSTVSQNVTGNLEFCKLLECHRDSRMIQIFWNGQVIFILSRILDCHQYSTTEVIFTEPVFGNGVGFQEFYENSGMTPGLWNDALILDFARIIACYWDGIIVISILESYWFHVILAEVLNASGIQLMFELF